jgi:hypothetical protein
MHHRPSNSSTAAWVAAVTALLAVLAIAAVAAASTPKVTIRIEGSKRTLLATTSIPAPSSGSITNNGAPKGGCPADSAAGVLNVATKGSWGGSWSSKYDDYLITKILGDTESGTKSYWEILVNNVAASTGACEIKLHPGERLVFAAVPLTGAGYPMATKAPASARAGKPFKVAVVYYDGKGVAKPLAGATVKGAGTSATTNAKGIARLTDSRAGRITLAASKNGYVRAAAVTVKVRS